EKQFGRSYGGCISEYCCDDADVIIVTIAGMTGAGMDAVDLARKNGIRAGLLKVRAVRPFPAKKIAAALKGKKAFAVIDRSVSFGWSEGPIHMEIKAAIADANEKYMHMSVIGGLGGADISVDDMYDCIEYLDRCKNEPGEHQTRWLMKD
ncbi:MAG: transketolase C-terminal domain-containing protein, partial [Eubacteriales bacterium]|nr:transketolase C-terminal domain-containing protein [Eubacteriales bacterium]